MTSRAMAAFAVTLVMIPLVVAAAILLTLPARDQGRGVGSARTPATSATPAAEASAEPTGSAVAPSPSVSEPPATDEPSPSPTGSPEPETVEVEPEEEGDIEIDGETVGTVRVLGYMHQTLRSGPVVVMKIRLEATETLDYSADDFVARSEDGEIFDDQVPTNPALGDGTLEAGERAEGWIGFRVPREGITEHVIYEPEGASKIIELRLD